jgi:hypothetical protein
MNVAEQSNHPGVEPAIMEVWLWGRRVAHREGKQSRDEMGPARISNALNDTDPLSVGQPLATPSDEIDGCPFHEVTQVLHGVCRVENSLPEKLLLLDRFADNAPSVLLIAFEFSCSSILW